MDFGTVLHKASKNDSQKKEVRYYSTKFEPPKKEQREKKTLSVNIQKFLARKESEEKQKAAEDRQRRDQLLELRSKDKKATRRVNVMLKRTKSANQSVLEDAVDANNTAVTLAGPSQPDEDDYGYVSQSASEYYNKMMDKYSKMPDEPKFKMEKKKVSTNLSGTMDRVKAALEREKEEALLPHKRKRKHKEVTDLNEVEVPEQKEPIEKKKEKPKPRLNMPPPMNFSDLLKMAEKKQYEPIMIEVKEKEVERPLTKKQKREADKEREFLEQKEARKANANKPAPPPTPTAGTSKPNNVATNPKTVNSATKIIPTSSNTNNYRPEPNKLPNSKPGHSSKAELNTKYDRPNTTTKPSNESTRLPNQSLNQKRLSENSQNHGERRTGQSSSMKSDPSRSSKPLQQNIIKSRDMPPPTRNPSQSQGACKAIPTSSKVKPSMSEGRHSDYPQKNIRPKEFAPRDMKPKQMASKDERPRQLPPNDAQRFSKKDGNVKKNFNPRRIYDDEDEDEYDSEMDDFIDDGEEEDVSRHIKEIFGYDKRKYSRNDDDCDDMESSFAQQMREEVISTKMAIKEDLEDMQLEEEQKKRKAMMKKRR